MKKKKTKQSKEEEQVVTYAGEKNRPKEMTLPAQKNTIYAKSIKICFRHYYCSVIYSSSIIKYIYEENG